MPRFQTRLVSVWVSPVPSQPWMLAQRRPPSRRDCGACAPHRGRHGSAGGQSMLLPARSWDGQPAGAAQPCQTWRCKPALPWLRTDCATMAPRQTPRLRRLMWAYAGDSVSARWLLRPAESCAGECMMGPHAAVEQRHATDYDHRSVRSGKSTVACGADLAVTSNDAELWWHVCCVRYPALVPAARLQPADEEDGKELHREMLRATGARAAPAHLS